MPQTLDAVCHAADGEEDHDCRGTATPGPATSASVESTFSGSTPQPTTAVGGPNRELMYRFADEIVGEYSRALDHFGDD